MKVDVFFHWHYNNTKQLPVMTKNVFGTTGVTFKQN